MFCNKCGYKLNGCDLFCPKCGTAVIVKDDEPTVLKVAPTDIKSDEITDSYSDFVKYIPISANKVSNADDTDDIDSFSDFIGEAPAITEKKEAVPDDLYDDSSSDFLSAKVYEEKKEDAPSIIISKEITVANETEQSTSPNDISFKKKPQSISALMDESAMLPVQPASIENQTTTNSNVPVASSNTTAISKAPQKKKSRLSPKKKLAIKITAIVLSFCIVLSSVIVALIFLNRTNEEDFIYHSSIENIAADSDTGTIYFNNLLIVHTYSNLTDIKRNALANKVDGEIVGDINGSINVLQILVEETDLEELNEKSSILMESEDVIFAGYEYPVIPQETADRNPWTCDTHGEEPDKNTQGTPNYNDWWAEAIGAYEAWESGYELNPITVGVMDGGFFDEHEDLIGKITYLSGYDKNTPDNHGTHVAGIIAANNNEVGIRGIVDHASLLCVDWDAHDIWNAGEYLLVLKQMYESGARVINNSWALVPKKTTEYEYGELKEYYKTKNDDPSILNFWISYAYVHFSDSYEEYLNMYRTSSERSALECMLFLYSMLKNGKEDFIIVQGASNTSMSTEYSGYFSNVSQQLYDKYDRETDYAFSKGGVTYDKLAEHKMIVGAVDNNVQNNNYTFSDFSSYGETVDICAPGRDICSTVIDVDEETGKPLKYDCMYGTSMATPIVTGCIAYLWSINPDLSAAEVKSMLINSSALGAYCELDKKTYPFVNLGGALDIYESVYGSTDIPESTAIAAFENMLKNSGDVWQFNCENGQFASMSNAEIIENFIVCRAVPIGVYNVYSSEGIQYTAETKEENAYADPKDKFWYSYELDANLVDWILQNVFGKTPDRSITSENVYYNGDKVYVGIELGGDLGYTYNVTNYEKKSDGKYEIYVESKRVDYASEITYLKFIATPKQDSTHGIYWQIHSYEMITDVDIIEPGTDDGYIENGAVDYKVGDYVTFGSYEQDNNTANGKEKIEWLILDIQNGQALVISKYALDAQLYNVNSDDVTWETCTLRRWLNDDFINVAFSSEEQKRIKITTVVTEDNRQYSTEGGNVTQDKIFLLSISEVQDYFGHPYEKSRYTPTAYALAEGCLINTTDENYYGNCYWWLRSPGRFQVDAAFVSSTGRIVDGGYIVNSAECAVCPVMWIALN